MAPISDSYLVLTVTQGRWTETFLRNNTTGCSTIKTETTFNGYHISVTYEEKKHFREAAVRVSFNTELSDRLPLRIVPETRLFTADGDAHDVINAVQKAAHLYIEYVKRTLDHDLNLLDNGYVKPAA